MYLASKKALGGGFTVTVSTLNLGSLEDLCGKGHLRLSYNFST